MSEIGDTTTSGTGQSTVDPPWIEKHLSKLHLVGRISGETVAEVARILHPAYVAERWRWTGHGIPSAFVIAEIIAYLIDRVGTDRVVGTGGLTIFRENDGSRSLYVSKRLAVHLRERPESIPFPEAGVSPKEKE